MRLMKIKMDSRGFPGKCNPGHRFLLLLLTSTRLFSSSLALLHNCGLGERVLCGRGIIGVSAGDGMGEGSSRIGERHLLIALLPLGISSRIDGGCKWLGAPFDLWALSASSTGTSMVPWRK